MQRRLPPAVVVGSDQLRLGNVKENSIDQLLRDLSAAAENGKWVPYIRVAAGSSVYMGTPGSSKQFIEKTKYGLGEDYYNHKRPIKKKDADGAYHESVAQAETAMQTLPSQMVQGAAEDAIVLIDAQVWPANGGDGIEVPVVRIPFAAVDGWWIGGGKKISAGGGGGWFFGVAVPLDLGD